MCLCELDRELLARWVSPGCLPYSLKAQPLPWIPLYTYFHECALRKRKASY